MNINIKQENIKIRLEALKVQLSYVLNPELILLHIQNDLENGTNQFEQIVKSLNQIVEENKKFYLSNQN